ncbi:RNA polymerase sigma-70 factor [Rhodocytophaga aerolata]|uniref:RNA polymerase sigma-70 factor n=1 Tax=Rhodocytophaga aerolata TaxID=455078 RepID=A0ABT8R9D3_9BACT|nr:RNA polymerase sigma-70 factor [Rhodocytophaga aerolata]MDO1448701.1 RNA polymerase sigma-70 factor [Rhodocytophaga aerolata]
MLSKYIHIDEQLTSRLKNGEDQAFREIFYHFHKSMYAIALKYLRDTVQAEDAVQEVFVKLWINRHQLDENLSVKGYLFTTLKNHLLNTLRNQKIAVAKQLEIGARQLESQNTTEDDLLLKEYQMHLTNGIQKLSPQRQSIFKMRFYKGLNNQEISQKLNISINTVKFQLSQATKLLKTYLKRDF